MFGIARQSMSAWASAPAITEIAFAGTGTYTAAKQSEMRGFTLDCCGRAVQATVAPKECYVDTTNLSSTSTFHEYNSVFMYAFKFDSTIWDSSTDYISTNNIFEDPEDNETIYGNWNFDRQDSGTTFQVRGGYDDFKPFGGTNDEGDTIYWNDIKDTWVQFVFASSSTSSTFSDWSPDFEFGNEDIFHRWCVFNIETGELIAKMDWAGVSNKKVDFTQSGTSTRTYTAYNSPYTHTSDPRLEMAYSTNYEDPSSQHTETAGFWVAMNQVFDPVGADGMLGHPGDTIEGVESFMNAFTITKDLDYSTSNFAWNLPVTNSRFVAATNNLGVQFDSTSGQGNDPADYGYYNTETVNIPL